MYTLVYLNGSINRPATLPSFLQTNRGKTPLLQIDCITPFEGSPDKLVEKVCEHLNNVDSQIKVTLEEKQNISTGMAKRLVYFAVIKN